MYVTGLPLELGKEEALSAQRTWPSHPGGCTDRPPYPEDLRLLTSSAISPREVSTLDHEVLDHPMEFAVFVAKSFLGKGMRR